MEEHEAEGDRFPSSGDTMHVPDNLFRKIAAPYDYELRKHSVYPKHNKTMGELAQVMKMLFGHHVRERLIFW